MNKKVVLVVAIILLVGTVGTVALLYSTPEDTDDIVAKFNRVVQQYGRISCSTVIELVENDSGEQVGDSNNPQSPTTGQTPTPGTGGTTQPTPPGTGGAVSPPNPTQDGCFSNMALRQTKAGVQYYGESQEKPWTAPKQKGSGPYESLDAGCMWFAMSAAVSWVEGAPVPIHELLHAVGFTSAVANTSSTTLLTPKIEAVGQKSDRHYPDGSTCSPENVLKHFVTVEADTGSLSSALTNYSFKDGWVFLVHTTNDGGKYSSSGQHWFVVVDTLSSGDYAIINGGGTQGKKAGYIPKGDLSGFDSMCNHCIPIKKK